MANERRGSKLQQKHVFCDYQKFCLGFLYVQSPTGKYNFIRANFIGVLFVKLFDSIRPDHYNRVSAASLKNYTVRASAKSGAINRQTKSQLYVTSSSAKKIRAISHIFLLDKILYLVLAITKYASIPRPNILEAKPIKGIRIFVYNHMLLA